MPNEAARILATNPFRFSGSDADTRIRIAASIAAAEPCSPIERAGRAIAACHDSEVDGSACGEVAYNRRASWYREQARAAIETLREAGPEMIAATCKMVEAMRVSGAGDRQIVEACFDRFLDVALEPRTSRGRDGSSQTGPEIKDSLMI